MRSSSNVNWNYSKVISRNENSFVLHIVENGAELSTEKAGNLSKVINFVEKMWNNLAIGMSDELVILFQSFTELKLI